MVDFLKMNLWLKFDKRGERKGNNMNKTIISISMREIMDVGMGKIRERF